MGGCEYILLKIKTRFVCHRHIILRYYKPFKFCHFHFLRVYLENTLIFTVSRLIVYDLGEFVNFNEKAFTITSYLDRDCDFPLVPTLKTVSKK